MTNAREEVRLDSLVEEGRRLSRFAIFLRIKGILRHNFAAERDACRVLRYLFCRGALNRVVCAQSVFLVNFLGVCAGIDNKDKRLAISHLVDCWIVLHGKCLDLRADPGIFGEFARILG